MLFQDDKKDPGELIVVECMRIKILDPKQHTEPAEIGSFRQEICSTSSFVYTNHVLDDNAEVFLNRINCLHLATSLLMFVFICILLHCCIAGLLFSVLFAHARNCCWVTNQYINLLLRASLHDMHFSRTS